MSNPAKRKYPSTEDFDPDTSGDQTSGFGGATGGGSSESDQPNNITTGDTYTPTSTGFTFKRLFNQYITNTPKTIAIDKATASKAGKIFWNWFRVPIDDLRFYLTPRTTDYIITSGTEFKINSVDVELKQFTVFTDQVYATSTGEKFTQFPTTNPFVFCYEDRGFHLLRRDYKEMQEWEIKTNATHQQERQSCTLKKFVTNIPVGMSVDEEDCELFNTNDWFIKDLKQPIKVHRKVNMPWCSIAGNLLREARSGDQKALPYRFPHISTLTNDGMYDINRLDTNVDAEAKIRQILQEPDNLKAWETPKQSMLLNDKPFGGPLKEFLIKPVPYSI